MNEKRAFVIEKMRALFARKKLFSDLVKTYSTAYPEIFDKNSKKFWDYLNSFTDELKNPIEEDRLKIVMRLIKSEGAKVLNVGFGSGKLEKYFLKENKRVHWMGIDISSKSVKSAVEKYKFGTFKSGDITNINAKNNSFDYVIVLEVLEHIKPRYTFTALNEIHRVLKREGYLIVSVPLNEGLEQMVLSQGINPNAHVRVYTTELIKAELEISGFKIQKVKELFAYSNYYCIKSFISKYFLSKIRKPNNVIILAQKG